MADPPDSGNSLAGRVISLRRRKSWSQAQLSEAAGLSLRTVQRVEQGGRCAPETLLALAATLAVDVKELTVLTARTPRFRLWGGYGVAWATPSRAAIIGAVLAAPSLLFVVSNVAVYELGIEEAEMLFPVGSLGEVLSHPVVLLGALVLGLILNMTAVLQFRARADRRQVAVDRIAIRLRPANIALVILTLGLLGVLFGYAVLENLGHLIEPG